MDLSTKGYNGLMGYAKHLMYGNKICDPGDLVNDAILNNIDNLSIANLRKDIRRNYFNEKRIAKSLVKIDSFKNFDESVYGGLSNFRDFRDFYTHRECTKCNKERPNNEFYAYSTYCLPGIILYSSHCKECVKKTLKEKKYHRKDSYKAISKKYIQSEVGRAKRRLREGSEEYLAKRRGRDRSKELKASKERTIAKRQKKKEIEDMAKNIN